MTTYSNEDPLVLAPAPWKTKATAYIIPIWTNSSTASNLPPMAYSPLEAASPFASSAYGKPQRSMGMIQLVRYHETPAGPYDEMVLVPGLFSYPVEKTDKNGNSVKGTKTARRITRIYVSQKHTAWNGRRNWNIPKHLARFDWSENSPSPGLTTVKVYPHDTSVPYNPSEDTPSKEPFFSCTLQSVKYVPSFPFRSSWLRYTGFDMNLVQPPVPDASGKTKFSELVGRRWVMVDDFYQASSRTSLVWADLRQSGGETQTKEGEYEKFWPGMPRWVVAVKLEDGAIELGEGKTWATPRSLL
ncbi:hypothetical protein QBC37DRAFT_283000 [Rhypophila decipiens]|uniref:Uncharacterized protein n=1 Tax=Rhypophila decipiens TaxID=261697 RepID=A0AAN6YB82_9PEZI|nr:hypothetical protein QBC37DRAFT_283000 [Rhypophila decipiens]